MNTLNTRGVAFSLNAFLESNQVTEPLLEKYHDYIEENNDKFSVHYCLKCLKNIRNSFKSEYCNKIIILLAKRLNATKLTSKIHELIGLMKSLNGLLVVREEEVQKLFKNIELKIIEIIKQNKHINSTQAAQIFNCFVLSNAGSPKFMGLIVSLIKDLNQIPKDIFAATLYSFVEMGLYE